MSPFGKTFALLAGLCVGLVSAGATAQTAAKPAAKPAAATATTTGAACISQEAQAELTTCPKGPTGFGETGKGPKASFHSAPPPQDLKKKDQQTKPGGPTEQMSAGQRDERRAKLQPKVWQLIITELQQLEALFGSTPPNSPDRMLLSRRLAEAYVELESAAFREKTEIGIKLDEAKAKKPADVPALQQKQKGAEQKMLASRKKAIEYYTLLKNKYPNYSQIDEVIYYLAYEYEQGNDYKNARSVYYELIQKAPQSKYIPNAYLAFGELFFNEAQGDPSKWDLAAASYGEVVKYPPPSNKVYGYAHYKLAYVYWNKGEFARALDEFKKTIDYGTTYAALPNAAPLAKAARRDLIPVYALAGRPDAAYNFFHTLSGDKANETAITFKMMDDLGNNYLDTGHYPEAVSLYHDLMARDKGDNFCRYQASVTQATMAMKSGNKEQIKAELDRQIEVYQKYNKESHPDELKAKCANMSAELVAETGMAWHLEAVGSGGVRGTGDQKTMTLAAYLYKKTIDNFTPEQFAKFEFPRIVKDDWPTIFKVKYAMADLLYFQQRWSECGPAFDAVVAEAPQSSEAPEAAYAAVLCYQNVYEQTHKKGEDRKGTGNMPDQAQSGAKAEVEKYKSKELNPNQKGMLTAFNRYVCYIKPKEGDKQALDQYIEVKYARARTYFESQHWEEAAIGFREVATTYPDKDVAIYAMQLYLESVNVLGMHSEPPRPSCFKKMEDDVPLFLKLFCEGDKFKTNQEQCTALTKIQCDIKRLSAEQTVKLADRGGPNALRTYEEAGNQYIALWREYGETPIKNKQPPQCEKLDEVVYNAAKAFQAGRLIAKSIQARLMLIAPENNMDKSSLAKKAVYEIGGNYQAIAVYDEAAKWYEKYARENPKGDKADKALSDAALLRLGLGQEKDAISDAENYTRQYGNAHPATAAALAFGIGQHYVDQEDWDKARKKLSAAVGQIEKNATYDVQVQTHGLLGRIWTKLKQQNEARGEYAKVAKLWSDPKAAQGKIMGIPDEDDGSKLRRMAKALTVVGEALFFFAEEKRVEVEKIKFPDYHGKGSKEEVLKHIKGPVLKWMEKKKPAIEKAQAEYKRIVDLQPVPPPRWVIAAGSQVGGLWGNFVREFRAAPIPADIKKDVELRQTYYAALDDASEPQKLQAKGAFETCLGYSVKFQFFDEYSRKCELWLSKNYKAEYHAVDEFKTSPTNVGAGLTERPYPVQMDGEVYNESPAPTAPEPKKEEAEDKKEETGKKGKAAPPKRKTGGPLPGTAKKK
jgi:tetratricopeptide (TPR) repeat protein